MICISPPYIDTRRTRSELWLVTLLHMIEDVTDNFRLLYCLRFYIQQKSEIIVTGEPKPMPEQKQDSAPGHSRRSQ